jgi:hypothetical protein
MRFSQTEQWQDFRRNPPAEPTAIESFQAATGITLPDEYVEFLRTANGGEGPVGGSAYVVLWRIEELATLNNAYEIRKYTPSLLLFGSDGGGEAFAFDLDSPNLAVVSVPFIGMSPDAIDRLAPSFRAFLETLSEPQ